MNARLRKQQADEWKQVRVDPVVELVQTVLSQHTSDINSERAFAALKQRFGSWEEVMEVPAPELAHVIRSGGLANQKAIRIQQIFREIEEREGRVSLERFNEMTDEEIEMYLTSLPGVGTKTAACVLAFALARPAFPVDTHVHRIVKRLGWVGPKASAERAYRELNPVIPPEIRYELHRRFIRHGRQICKAQRPQCSICPIFDFCDAGPRLLALGEAR